MNWGIVNQNRSFRKKFKFNIFVVHVKPQNLYSLYGYDLAVKSWPIREDNTNVTSSLIGWDLPHL